MSSHAKQLRRLLESPEIVVAPGAFGPMVARLIERAGFNALYMTGGGTAFARQGYPDVGLVTMSEMAANAAAITDTVDIPLIADADTGYGNELNVRRTVREYERAGVAALHIEDQVFPKRCGHFQGKRLIPAEDMARKIRVALDARRDSDFVIIARCDAILVEGLDAALARGEVYVKAGADALFIESPRTVEEIRRIGSAFEVPLVLNMASSGKTPFLSAAEVQDLGFAAMIFPNFATLAAIKVMTEVLDEIKRTGSAEGVLHKCASFAEFMDVSGLHDVMEFEKQFDMPAESHTSW